MKAFRGILCILVMVVAGGVTTASQTPRTNMSKAGQQRFRSPFRYVIISNKVDRADPKQPFRDVEVLLDAAAFSEQTLKELFRLVGRRFPRPEWLKIWVYTSLEQVETPEEAAIGYISETDGDPRFDQYHWAFLMREDGRETLRYNPHPPSTEEKSITLKNSRSR